MCTEFSINIRCSCPYNHPENLSQKSIPPLQLIFTPLFPPYLSIKSSLQSPLTLSSSIPQQYLIFLFLRTAIATVFIKSIFPTSIIQPIQGTLREKKGEDTYEQGSLLRTEAALVSLIFLKLQTGRTITLSPRLKKLVYCRQQFLMKMFSISVENHPIRLLPQSQPIVTTYIPYYYHHKNSHSPINQLISILTLAFSYTIMLLSTYMFRSTPLLPLNLESYQTRKQNAPLALWNQATGTTLRVLIERRRCVTKMFGSCSSKLDGVSLALWILAKVTANYMESLQLLNIIGNSSDVGKYSENFCLAPRWKINWPR